MKHSKTVVTIIIMVLIVIAVASYYVAAVRNSDNRPESVERASVLLFR